MGTTTIDASKIFAYDKEGYDICVDDMVIYRKKLYKVESMEHEVTNDGYYTESVYLLLADPVTDKYVVVEDNKVALSF
jgi:hypothetical protein